MLLQSLVSAILLLLKACNGKLINDELINQNNAVHQTSWTWNIDTDKGQAIHDEITFKFYLRYAKPEEFWRITQGITMYGDGIPDSTTHIAFQPATLDGGKEGIIAKYYTDTRKAAPADKDCKRTPFWQIVCTKYIEVPYETLWTITYSKMKDSLSNSWIATLNAGDKNIRLGRFDFNDYRLIGIKNSQSGMIEDIHNHYQCTRKSPIAIDIYPPETNGLVGTIGDWKTSGHCPDEDPRYWYQYMNGTWGYWQT